MLEKIREGSQGMVAKVLLGLIILSFALVGVGGYLGTTPTPPAATVNGEEITPQQHEQRYNNNRARMEQQFGQFWQQLSADEGYMKNFRDNALTELVNEALEGQLAEDMGLRVGDEQLKKIIRELPQFQVGGQFDNNQYLNWLRQVGYQPNTFRDDVRNGSVRNQLRQAVLNSDFSLPSEVKRHNELDKQKRDIEYIVFKQADYKDQVILTDQEKQNYYDANLESFRTQEMLSLEYVELKVSDFMKGVAVSDAEIEQYYQDNIGSYRTNIEKRRISHIFIEFGDDEDSAKTKTTGLLDRVKGGEEFATVAAQASDDTFSGENGGDLEWSERGVWGDAIDAAAFDELKNVNDLSEIVRGEDGFHILKLTGIEAESVKSFDEVKDQVASELKRNQAIEIYEDKQGTLNELAFEASDNLEEPAAAIDVDVRETALFSRLSAPPVVNFPPVIQAAFSDQVLIEGINSELIEVGNDHVMVIRLKKHEPSRIQNKDEVASQIDSALNRQKAEELAKAKAEEVKAKLDGTQKLADDEDTKSMTIVAKVAADRNTAEVDSSVRTEVFKMPRPEEGKVSTGVYKMSNGDFALVALSKVVDGEQPEDVKPVQQRLASQKSQQSYASFVESLKEKAEVIKEGDEEVAAAADDSE